MARDLFTCLSDTERVDGLRAYEAFLAARDGEPDFVSRTLPLREAAMQRFMTTPLRWSGRIDPQLFASQYRRFDRSRATPPEMLLLLAFVKVNANEAFAVEKVYQCREPTEQARHRLERIVMLEERYHTRLLLSAGVLFDISVSDACLPAPMTRRIAAGIAGFPDVAARPLTFAGEILAMMTFQRLLDAVDRVFPHGGPVRDALAERAMEILIDEVGHASFHRLLLGRSGFMVARALLPVMALSTRNALPEAEMLSLLPFSMTDVGTFEFRKLPAEVLRRAFVA